MLEEDNKKIVPLSVKALANYEKTPFPGNPEFSPGPVVSTDTNVKKLKLVDCHENHIGPKIVASHVTVHLPKESKFSRKSVKWFLISTIIIVLLLAVALVVTFTIPKVSSNNDDDDDIIDDGGEHPADWYYTRTDRNASECDDPRPRIMRDHLVIDSLDRTCVEPMDCLQLVQSLTEDSDFYFSAGRVYEGFGWNCNPRKRLRLTFLSKGKATQLDMYSFNSLVKVGVNMKEMYPSYDVFPACCVEKDSHGPSRGILLFLKTLTSFRERECIGHNANCQQAKV